MPRGLPFLAGVLCVLLLGGGAWWLLHDPATEAATGGRPPGVAAPGDDAGSGRAIPDPEVVRREDDAAGDAAAAVDPAARVAVVVVDATASRPLADVTLVDQRDGTLLGRTDAEGRAQVAPDRPTDLLCLRAGYLHTVLLPGTPATEAALEGWRRSGVLRLAMQEDTFTVPLALRFVSPVGAVPGPVSFRLVPLDDPPPSGGTVPRGRLGPGAVVSSSERAAWELHALLVSRLRMPALAPAAAEATLHHLGIDSADERFECGADVNLRLVAGGRYRVAARGNGLFADVVVDVPSAGRATPQEIRMREAAFATGVVVGAVGERPVAGALVVAEDAPLGRAETRSAADGRFRIGPFAAGTMPLVQVSHARHEPATARLTTDGRAATIRLASLPGRTLRGVVTSRAGGRPLFAASVRLLDGLEQVAATSSDRAGRFEIEVVGGEPALRVLAPGHLPYLEALPEDGPLPTTFALVPDTPAGRVEAGLTALVAGVVVDAAGRAAVGLPVRCMPENAPAAGGVPGRSILEGGVPVAPGLATTDANGRFEMEVTFEGAARLVPVDGTSTFEDGLAIVVQRGRQQRDLRLRSR